ncbi:DoxX family membrane protein [Flagellimonas zhangzhouensis]|uniref:DoxX protein n=1 Tax=Flagellimonas zhangzhouensis TaxID=1073328 RepID=A0A1H2XZA5_9FLAO|nr:DoxX family membrane protein [Allomuricauda zhangzhouensis]SDQ93501.1 DoxX protein [Allomuricauda zhangzhouensis]SDW98150.1 DoxX protein [Allomuricauda zhangzhouensis]
MKQNLKNQLISIAIGLVYLWFGALKFIPHLSPAEDLAKNTIHQLTFGFMADDVALFLLAVWEVGLGILLVLGLFRRYAIMAALVHMVLTFTPLFFFPDQVFTQVAFGLSLVGQYIFKNLIIIAALVSIYERKRVTEDAFETSSDEKESLPLRVLIGKNLFKKV